MFDKNGLLLYLLIVLIFLFLKLLLEFLAEILLINCFARINFLPVFNACFVLIINMYNGGGGMGRK